MNNFETPILLVTFNRPDLTRCIINELSILRPKLLYFVSDGARPGNDQDRVSVNETRELLNLVNWPCTIHKLFRVQNLGCKQSVSQAITWFFSKVEFGIILEDDCLPSLSFFYYCQELLHKFRNNAHIGLITGQSHYSNFVKFNSDYSYSKYATIWGWASWSRVWRNYDVEMTDWPINKISVLQQVGGNQNRKYWEKIFSQVFSGRIDTWDYQLVYLLLKNRQLTVTPRVNLISNLGFDSRATHTKDSNSHFSNFNREDLQFPLIHNKNYKEKYIDEYLEKNVFREYSIVQKIIKYYFNVFRRKK